MTISKIVPQSTGFGDANVGLQIPNISLANRAASAANGSIIFNTSNNAIEVYANGAWTGVGTVRPTISDVIGTIDSGNTGSKINIVGTNFGDNGALSQGTLRFNYNGITDVAVTPNTTLTINGVSIPSNVLNQPANTSGTIQFIRSDGSSSNPFTKVMSANTITIIDYLLVAGGGGGGTVVSGGGGAGGVLLGTTQVALTTPYTVTIGGGGAGAVFPADQGTPGSNSSFSLGPYTAIGGGGGGGDTPGFPGLPGGSGGGTLRGTFGSGTPGQGNNGGNGNASPVEHGAGGGGGAGGVGQDGTLSGPTGLGGNGGIGIVSSIAGGSHYWAGGGGGSAGLGGPAICGNGGLGGGGGGGGQTPATQGLGGGSTAPSPSTGGFNGSAPGGGGAGGTNTGGGGGGGPHVAPTQAGAGGSGILVLKYPDLRSLTNPGGGLTISTTTSAPSKISRITSGTGTIQFTT
jgi:hypothetical protein